MTLTFGEKVKTARKLKKLTQKQLAEKIGAAHNSVSDWENDKNKPDPDTIELLCGVLEITPNYLLASTPDEFSPSEKLLIRQYRSLDSFGQETVSYILDRELERTVQLKEWQDKNSPASKLEEGQVIYLPELYSRFSAGTGQYSTDSGYEMTQVPRNSLTSQATSIATISGDSMEPEYQNGDRVLIKTMPDIEIGEIGVWSINNELYIKAKGEGELISLNPDYDNIAIKENDSAYCIGKVLGKLD